MSQTVLRMHYPRGALPVLGFRCSACGEEVIRAEEVAELQALARRLNMYGVKPSRVRRLQRTGGSLSVTLDRELLGEMIDDVRAGAEVRVGFDGERIVIEAA